MDWGHIRSIFRNWYHQKMVFFQIFYDYQISFSLLIKKQPFIICLPKKQRIYDYYEFASEALHIVIFENFVKPMTSCLSHILSKKNTLLKIVKIINFKKPHAHFWKLFRIHSHRNRRTRTVCYFWTSLHIFLF